MIKNIPFIVEKFKKTTLYNYIKSTEANTLIKIFKRMEHMNTSITQDLLELIVPTAIEWDQLLPET